MRPLKESAMTRSLRLRLLPLLAALILPAAAGGAHSNCDSLINEFNTVLERAVTEIRQGSLDPGRASIGTLKALEKQIGLDAACGNRLVDVQRRRIAAQLSLAQQLIVRGATTTDAEYERVLADADEPDVSWRAAYAVGEVRFAQRRYADSALAYDRAIENIKNATKTPTSPGEQVIKAVVDRAAQARMLAANEENKTRPPVFVPAAKDHRDGTVGGALSASIRGVSLTKVPLPIQFETASAKFTAVGEAAANELLAAIREQLSEPNPPGITIIGHTDERGADDYNLRLSVARAEAVAKFLRDNGIKAKVVAIGRGKREPVELPNASEFAREEIWALNRRVEWKRD
jgi:outer membrane protein OmpA-like peptidoglycan-associated protein